MTATPRSRSVEERLRLLEDKEEILRTLHQYVHALDYGKRPEDLTDCFTEDGVWYSTAESKSAGAAGVRIEGRQQLAEWFSRNIPVRGTPGHFAKHIVAVPDIRIEGDNATARTYLCTMRETEAGPLPFAMGQYFDTLVRSSDGRWRFKERHLAQEAVHQSRQDKPIG
jgi:hypothetical protein